jgi:hypothetical protein
VDYTVPTGDNGASHQRHIHSIQYSVRTAHLAEPLAYGGRGVPSPGVAWAERQSRIYIINFSARYSLPLAPLMEYRSCL